MNPDDAVDRTIRNQRYRGWPGWLWIGGWGLLWMPVAVVVETGTPDYWRVLVLPATSLLMVASCVPLIVFLDRQPVRRLRLGDDLRGGGRRFGPAGVRAIRLTADPDEDYVESRLPIRLCQVTVETRRGCPLRLVVSVGDAARLRRWAEGKGIAVIDPEGYSARGGPKEPG
jgi:hypothetical protein